MLPYIAAALIICITVCDATVPVVRFDQQQQLRNAETFLNALRHSAQSSDLDSHIFSASKYDRDHQPLLHNGLVTGNKSLCECRGYNCGCCIHLKVKDISLDNTGCLNISYLPSELGIEFTMSIDGIILIDDKVSVRNPPPICAAIPYFHKLASVCVKFRDLQFKGRQFSGCASFTVLLAEKTIADFKIGCFHIPPSTGIKSSEHKNVVW